MARAIVRLNDPRRLRFRRVSAPDGIEMPPPPDSGWRRRSVIPLSRRASNRPARPRAREAHWVGRARGLPMSRPNGNS
jgi:hypothetical protein